MQPLTPKEQKTIVALLACEWAVAATCAAIPIVARVWDFPVAGTLKQRLKWSNLHQRRARELRVVLEKFGVVVPAIDHARYVVPKKNGPNVEPGDLWYSHDAARTYRAELIAAIGVVR